MAGGLRILFYRTGGYGGYFYGEYARSQCGGSGRADHTAEVPGAGTVHRSECSNLRPGGETIWREEAAGGQRDSGDDDLLLHCGSGDHQCTDGGIRGSGIQISVCVDAVPTGKMGDN